MRLWRLFTCGVWILLIVGVLAPEVLLGQTPSVRVNSRYTYDMLDPTTNINRKLLVLLDARRGGEVPNDSVTFGGAVTAIADVHQSNVAGKIWLSDASSDVE